MVKSAYLQPSWQMGNGWGRRGKAEEMWNGNWEP